VRIENLAGYGGFGSLLWFGNQYESLAAAETNKRYNSSNDVGLVEIFLPNCGKLRVLRSTSAVFQFMARLPFIFHPYVLDLRSLTAHRGNSEAEHKQRQPCLHRQRLLVRSPYHQTNEMCGTQTWFDPRFGAFCYFPTYRI